MRRKSVLIAGASCLALASGYAHADAAGDTSGKGTQIETIVVTAEKRSEDINTVPMSVQAFSGDTLKDLGVSGVEGLTKLVPGFSVASTFQGTPFYTLRGIGYSDSYLGGSPAVTVYNDEVPLTFPSMTRLAGIDVERVEVQKGPQGTIFGSNATGGAVNYIAARPTDHFAAGVTASYGNFDTKEIEGYLSGPIGDTVGARLAVKSTTSGPWQDDYLGTGAKLGRLNQLSGRLSMVWTPSDIMTDTLTVSGWRDKSDAPVPQVRALTQLNLAGCNLATTDGCIPP
ncbi:MAG TPA: TonB-dependent receptor plug domain-containing protein, partial [Rhizomicrobium sp.]